MTNDTIYSRFKEIAEKYPDDPAIIEDDRTVSFSNLDAMADCILAKFYDRIPSPEYVGIVMSHGAEQVAAMLAVLKSGAGYIPAEPTLPQERIDYMMKSAGAGFIINDNFCRHLKLAKRHTADRSQPDGVAYVLYTSGTSGEPKEIGRAHV